jgi:hypothetical protein
VRLAPTEAIIAKNTTAQFDAQPIETGKVSGKQRWHETVKPPREQKARTAAEQAQHEIFDKKLSSHADPACAQSTTDR